MNAELLEIISYISFACAFLFLILSIVLFVRLKIPAVIDDLSGKKAERQIKAYREQRVHRQENVTYTPLPQAEETAKLDAGATTTLLYTGTSLLDERIVGSTGWELILDEMIIHTEERV